MMFYTRYSPQRDPLLREELKKPTPPFRFEGTFAYAASYHDKPLLYRYSHQG